MKKQFLLHLVFVAFAFGLAVVLTLPVIGFVYGCIEAKGVGDGLDSIFPRIFIGVVCAVLTTFEGGRMPHDFGVTAYTDLRHHIIPTFFSLSTLFYSTILLFLAFLHFIRRRKRQS